MIAVYDLDNFLPVSCIKAADGNISHVICTDKRTGTDSIFTMAEIEEVLRGAFMPTSSFTDRFILDEKGVDRLIESKRSVLAERTNLLS